MFWVVLAFEACNANVAESGVLFAPAIDWLAARGVRRGLGMLKYQFNTVISVFMARLWRAYTSIIFFLYIYTHYVNMRLLLTKQA